ncbi:10325_t:CDS:2, partial [Gigaspora rosea]
MALLVILTIVFILFLIYNFYLNTKIPNGLKDIHTITLIENIKNSIMENSSAAKYYLNSKEYFDNDGIAKLQIGGKWMCLLSDPTIAKDMFLRTVLPIDLFVDVGFKLMNIMETIDNKPIDVVDLMHSFTLDVLGKAVFDFDFNNLGNPNNVYVTTYNEVQDEVNNFLFLVLPLDLIPYFKNRRLGKVKKLQKLFDDFIKNKHKSMAAGKSNGDLLELMIKACDDPNNEGFNDIELRVQFLPWRKLTEDLKYKNHVIPAGTGVSLFIYAMQHSPKLWENPEEFIPERFENEKNINGTYTWTPFGAGSR